MAEYIEREAAISSVVGCVSALCDEELEYLLNSIPAADVVEVVHSRWKYFRKQGIAVCMNCSFERKLDDNFGRAISCPSCGARMDGEG